MDDDDGRTHGTPRPRGSLSPGRTSATAIFDWAQGAVTGLVGVALLLLALVLLGVAVYDFFHTGGGTAARASGFLDQVLFVLILVEIVHTVALSLRSHRLQAEPFIVVALIAAIRKLLFVLGGRQPPSTAQFALLLSMAVVFIAALVALRRWAPGRT